MTTTAKTTRIQYTGTGSVDTYPYDWKILDEADLAVISTDTDGVDTTLTLNSDYTVTGAGVEGGGNVVLSANLPLGYTLTIYMDMDITQDADLSNQGGYFLETLEDALDRQCLISQQLQTLINRCVQLPQSSSEDPSEIVSIVEQAAAAAQASENAAEAAQTAAEEARDEAVAASENITVRKYKATATAGQTVITPGFTWDDDAGNVAVFIDGLKQAVDTYTLTSPTLTLDSALSGGETVEVYSIDFTPAPSAPLYVANNLSDLESTATALTNLGVSAFGQTLLDDASASAARATLGVAESKPPIGSIFLARDGDLCEGVLECAGAAVSRTTYRDLLYGSGIFPFDLTAATFLDEKGSISTFTCDTANTSGHFNAAVPARVIAGCRIVIAGTSYPILSIAGDGTGANAVVFTGTLAAGAHTVSGIYGVVLDDTSLRLGADKRTTDICTGGTPVSSDYYSSQTPSKAFDDSTSTYWESSATGSGQWIGYTFSAMHAVYHVGLYTDSSATHNSSSVRIDYTTNGGSSWTTGSTYAISNTASSWVYIALTAPIVCNGIRIVNLTTLGARWVVEEIIVYDMDLSAVSVVYPISLAADCTDWTAITAVSVSETLNSQNLWYALSFDGGTTYSAFVGSAWLPIVRNNSGTWEYWTGSAWAASTINSALGAMAQAAGVAGNQMTGAVMAGLSQAQIEGSGGFVPGQTSLPVLMALYSTSTTATPILSEVKVTTDPSVPSMPIGTAFGSGDGSTTFNLPNLTPPTGCMYVITYE